MHHAFKLVVNDKEKKRETSVSVHYSPVFHLWDFHYDESNIKQSNGFIKNKALFILQARKHTSEKRSLGFDFSNLVQCLQEKYGEQKSNDLGQDRIEKYTTKLQR